MDAQHLQAWDLKTTISELVAKAPSIASVHIFGSRARRTNSYRSDIDLLVHSPRGLAAVDLGPWVNDRHNPVDLFETNDQRNARSLINGSTIYAERGTVVDKLDAILLWSKESGFSEEFDAWSQYTVRSANFAMSILPGAGEITSTARRFASELLKRGLPNTVLGTAWEEIALAVVRIVEGALLASSQLHTRAPHLNPSAVQMANEYDFQNLIYLTLKPWLPTLETEPFVVRFDGQKKSADFSLEGNGLVIEAKHIRDAGTKAAVMKTLSGLSRFYTSNPNVRALLFLILVDETVEIDERAVEGKFSRQGADPPVIVRVLKAHGRDGA